MSVKWSFITMTEERELVYIAALICIMRPKAKVFLLN